MTTVMKHKSFSKSFKWFSHHGFGNKTFMPFMNS